MVCCGEQISRRRMSLLGYLNGNAALDISPHAEERRHLLALLYSNVEAGALSESSLYRSAVTVDRTSRCQSNAPAAVHERNFTLGPLGSLHFCLSCSVQRWPKSCNSWPERDVDLETCWKAFKGFEILFFLFVAQCIPNSLQFFRNP